MKLTIAERLLIGQIVNVKLNSATLREHIRLKAIYDAADPDGTPLPIPIDFVDEEFKDLFEKYNNKRIDDIEDKDHQKILRNAMMKSNEARNKIWLNDDQADFVAKFSDDDIQMLKNFYDNDKRTFPRQYHKAILSLNEKINNKKKR